MKIDTSLWSADGDFTQVLLDTLRTLPGIAELRVEDAPTSRADAVYQFLSNEIFVGFEMRAERQRVIRFGFLPASHLVLRPVRQLGDLELDLRALEHIGAPDYADLTMLQYLRTQRVVQPYQTQGYKLVELVRIYRMDAVPVRS